MQSNRQKNHLPLSLLLSRMKTFSVDPNNIKNNERLLNYLCGMFVGVRLLPKAWQHLSKPGTIYRWAVCCVHPVIFYFSTRESHHCWTGASTAVLSGIRTGLRLVQAFSGLVWGSFSVLWPACYDEIEKYWFREISVRFTVNFAKSARN